MLLENLKGLPSRYQFLFMFLFLIDLLLEDTHTIETASLRPLLVQLSNVLVQHVKTTQSRITCRRTNSGGTELQLFLSQ